LLLEKVAAAIPTQKELKRMRREAKLLAKK